MLIRAYIVSNVSVNNSWQIEHKGNDFTFGQVHELFTKIHNSQGDLLKRDQSNLNTPLLKTLAQKQRAFHHTLDRIKSKVLIRSGSFSVTSSLTYFSLIKPSLQHATLVPASKGFVILVVPFVPGMLLASPLSRHLLLVPFPGIILPGILLPHFTWVTPQMLPFKESFSTALLHHHSLSLTWFNFFFIEFIITWDIYWYTYFLSHVKVSQSFVLFMAVSLTPWHTTTTNITANIA